MMKRLFVFFVATLLTTAYVSAQTAYAIWCEGNKTVYFDYTNIDIQPGSTYDGQTVTSVKTLGTLGRNVTGWGRGSLRELVKTVRFMSTFKVLKPTDLSYMFQACWYLERIIDIKFLNTSEVTDMSFMFESCFALTSLDLSSFDTSNVTKMDYMFNGCKKLASLDVSGFNTAKANQMRQMFYECESLTNLNLSNFDTSNVTVMESMFAYCESLVSLDISSFNTSNVTTMRYMFSRCKNLMELDVSKFVTSKVTNMKSMFDTCGSLTTLNLLGFDTSNVTDMERMFNSCTSLKTIYCNDTWSTNYSRDMFYGCTSLAGVVPFNRSYVDVSMANPTTGYFTAIHMYNLWLGGVQVTSVNKDEIPVSKGKASYEPFTKTLTLTGVYIENGDNDYCIQSEIEGGLTMVLEGVNKLKSTKNGLGFTSSDLTKRNNTILGAGQLTIEASEVGIGMAYCDLAVLDCGEVTITAPTGILSSLTLLYNALNPDKVPDEDYERLIIFNTNVTVQGIVTMTKLLLDENSVYMEKPAGGYFKFPTVYDTSGNVSEKLVIKKLGIPGDVNEDGKVDINDVVAIINRMAGTASWPNADVNGDNDVNINDVVAVINIMAGN